MLKLRHLTHPLRTMNIAYHKLHHSLGNYSSRRELNVSGKEKIFNAGAEVNYAYLNGIRVMGYVMNAVVM